jgi:single-strand DNA-binding protein
VNDTHVTVVGNVVDAPRRNPVGDTYVTNFRIASNARRFDSDKQDYVTSGSFYADVECWGDLGGNVSRSIAKGHSVIVTGTLTTREWESEKGKGSTSRIRADAVGPNLRWGWAELKRAERDAPEDRGTPEQRSDEPVRGRDYEPDPHGMPPVDSGDGVAVPALR